MTRRTITGWVLVHKWASLASTAFLLMLCATGLPLIFHAEIDDLLAPSAPISPTRAGTRPPSLDTLLAHAVRPGEVPLYMSFDIDRPVVNVTTAARADAAPAAMRFVSFDRRTGRAIAPRATTFTDFLLRLHTDMLLGLPGELFLGAMGLAFLAAIASGVVLYAPFMAKLAFGTVRRGRGQRIRRLDRHNLIGIVTLAWAGAVAATGVVNTLALPVTALWKADRLAAIAAPGPVVAATASVQDAIDDAIRASGGMRPQFVAFPGTPYSSHRHYAVFLQGPTPLTAKLLTPAFVDARSGRLDAVMPMPWYMKALLLAQPLHFGDYGGMAMKLLWAVLDLLTIAVLVTGVRLWAERRGGPASLRAREVLSAGEASIGAVR